MPGQALARLEAIGAGELQSHQQHHRAQDVGQGRAHRRAEQAAAQRQGSHDQGQAQHQDRVADPERPLTAAPIDARA